MFLNSYARACESGSIPAEELADQILLGFPLPKSFAQTLLICALRISQILSLCLILLAFWYSKLIFAKFPGDGEADGKVNTIHFVVFVIWGLFNGFGGFLASMGRTTSSLMQRLNQMRTLNKMLSGASGSAWCGLPHIQVDKPDHLLMWMEIRALCLASDRPQQLQREVNVAVTTALSTGMAMVSLFWVSSGSLQNHEKPGLLYFQSLLTVLLYVINLPHVLLAGILANLEHHQSINLLSQHMLQAQFALLHGPNTNFTDQERAKIRETLEVSKTLSQQLAMDSTQIVSVFGVPLTTASASALASLFSSVIIFAIHNDAVQHLLGQVNGRFNWAEVVEEFGNFSNFTSFTFWLDCLILQRISIGDSLTPFPSCWGKSCAPALAPMHRLGCWSLSSSSSSSRSSSSSSRRRSSSSSSTRLNGNGNMFSYHIHHIKISWSKRWTSKYSYSLIILIL